MPNSTFANEIKKIRSNNNLSMQDLANILDVTKGAVSMWENKGVVPREDLLIKISRRFNISIDKLLGNTLSRQEDSEKDKLMYIQRGLSNLDKKQLEKAENILKAVFDDIFDIEEDDDDDF